MIHIVKTAENFYVFSATLIQCIFLYYTVKTLSGCPFAKEKCMVCGTKYMAYDAAKC